MTIQDPTLAQLRNANPVISDSPVSLPETSATAFLETLETRRDLMITKDQPTTGSQGTRRNLAFSLGLAAVVAVIGAIAWLASSGDEQDIGTDPETVVQEFLDRRASGDMNGALDLMTPELAERERDFFEGLGAWNSRGEQEVPCRPLTSFQLGCVLSEVNDFHAAGGLTPYATNLRLTVNADGLVSGSAIGISEWSILQTFNNRFAAWLAETHPDAFAAMTGVPMGRAFGEADARIALKYVEEFVAQSDQYPLP